MATVNKNFRIKNGLVVEGSTATVNGQNVLTETGSDNYILSLIGGESVISTVASGLAIDGSKELSIDRTVVDTWYDASGAASSAQTAAQSYADGLAVNYDLAGSATTAYNNAVTYADGLATNYDASGAASTVQGNLEIHTGFTSAHGVTGAIVGTSDTQSLTNKTITDSLKFQDGGNNWSAIHANTNDLNIDGSANITLTTNTGDIVLNPDGHAYIGSAIAANEIATHSYVDNAVSGLNWKQAANLLYNDTTPTLSGDSVSSPLVIDGHTALGLGDVGYRILVSGGDDAGIYAYNQTGTSWTLDRATDADAFGELIGAAIFIMEGTTYGGSSWVQANHYLTGFTGQDWTQFSGSGTVTAGNGILVDGLEVSIDTSVVATQSDLSTGLGGKQDTLTTGSNISIINDVISVSGLASTDISDFNTAAVSANSGLWDDTGSAAAAQSAAEAYADGLASNYEVAGAASTAQTNANSYTDGQITNLTDGTNSFQTLNIEDVIAQRASGNTGLSTMLNVVFEWAAADYRSAKVLVKVANGVHTQISELMVTLDTSNNVAVSEYGITYSNGTELAAITADYLNGNVRILATPANASTNVTVFATLVI